MKRNYVCTEAAIGDYLRCRKKHATYASRFHVGSNTTEWIQRRWLGGAKYILSFIAYPHLSLNIDVGTLELLALVWFRPRPQELFARLRQMAHMPT